MNLKTLARELGLSPTTVSRALNGYPEVSEATRLRVQEAARRANYRPNTQAQRLATGRAMAIGHIIPISTRYEIVNPVFTDFIAGAGEVYAQAGYDMIMTIVPDDAEARAYAELRSRGNVDGVLVHAPRIGDHRLSMIEALGLPYVVHGRAGGVDRTYSWVDVNNARAFERATNLLLDLGHRRIALINGIGDMDFAHRRRCGYARALTGRGIGPDPEIITEGEMTEAQGHDGARAMLATGHPPTAFLTASLLSAMGVRRAVEEAGLMIGRDISIVTHDDELSYLKNGTAGEPIFTATRSPVRHAGRRCAGMLLAQIESGDRRPRSELMEAVLVIGSSTGPFGHGQDTHLLRRRSSRTGAPHP